MASLEEAIVFMLLALAVVATVEETREQCLQRIASCTDNERPVCGTNNVTYSSKCQLMRAQCQPTLTVVTLKHRGRCRNKIKPRSKCLQHLEFAKSRIPKANDKSSYIPSCEPDGSFAPVQCHENTGFCWCVDTNGQPVSNTNLRKKRNGKIRCIRHEKSATKRRSSLRGKGNKRNCNLSDKAIFNSNLIDKFHAEWVLQHEGTGLHGHELDRVVLDWKFKEMDKNGDGQLDKTEYRDLRKLVKIFVKPKRCSKSFARACDINQDQHISSQEWADCLTRDGMNDEKPSGPDLDNSSSDRDDDEDDADDYDDLDDFPHPSRSPPPHGILQNGGSLIPGMEVSGEDSNERHDEEATDCLSDRQAVLNEHGAGPSGLYVPECTPDGRYKKIQCYKSVGYCWCVHEDTGKNIPGTSVQHATPKCDQVPASTRPMKGCPEPKKTAFLKDLMDFLHSRMVAGTNDTNITGSESGWQAPPEEKAATWNFVVLDKNKNKVLERKEWKVFRALVSDKKQLRRCGKKLPRYCDVNNDQKISLSEWLDCLNTKRNTTQQGSTSNPRPASQRQGKNPLTSFLKDD